MEQTKATEAKKLHEVISIVPRFSHRGGIFKDVQINWFIKHRDGDNEPPVPYEEAIVGYEQLSAARKNSQEGTPEEAVRELFTEGEAEALREYLLAVHNDDTATLEEINLPLDDKHTWPLGGLHIVTPGPCGFYMLSEEPRYNLPFKVWGFYDVRDCECIEEMAQRPAGQNGSVT